MATEAFGPLRRQGISSYLDNNVGKVAPRILIRNISTTRVMPALGNYTKQLST